MIANAAAAARAVKFWDKQTAPIVGTDAPKRTIIVPAGSEFVGEFRRGKQFALGLWMAVTVNPADTDTTAPAAGDILATVDFA
jgi:hypothetical protein